MKNNEKSAVVTGAQIAFGENYAAPFWNDVARELTAIETGKSKSKLQVKQRWTKPATIGHY